MPEESTVLDNIDQNKAVAIFTGGLEDTLSRIAADLKNFTPDISTDAGRKEIKSRAYKASLCKGKLDEMGKKLNEEAQKHIKAVNADRNRAEAFLDALRDEIRKPVTDWENAEKDRVAAHEAEIAEMVNMGPIPNRPSYEIGVQIDTVKAIHDNRDWEEFSLRAVNVKTEILAQLEQALSDATKRESEQAELEVLRAEKIKREAEEAERVRIAREAQIAADAAEKARKDAEDKAARDAKEAADKAAAELEKARQAEIEAERRAGEAIEAAKRAEEEAQAEAKRAELARIEAIEKAERDRLAAEAKAKADQEEAVEAERKRAADAKAAEDAATAAREEDKAHKAKINNEALQALAALDCVMGEIPAKAIVIAIAEGRIPNVFIRY